MATPTISVTFADGNVLTAAQLNSSFTNLLNAPAIVNADISAGAGIVFSKLDSTTVAGVTATQTLTNKTLTNPTITSLYRARAYLAGAQNIINGTEIKVLLDTVDYDSNSNFSSSRYTAPVTGYYLITGRASPSDGTGVDGTRFFSIIYKNGTGVADGGGYFANTSLISPFVTEILLLTAGDYIELYALQFTGVTIALQAGNKFTSLAVHLLSQ